ncbi:MAG: hypothetical protein ABEJ80_08700 [Halarchaeum sp.]
MRVTSADPQRNGDAIGRRERAPATTASGERRETTASAGVACQPF